MSDIERLESEKEKAWQLFDGLRGPHDAAYKKYQQLANEHKEALLYAKIRRQVMRDLINSASTDK